MGGGSFGAPFIHTRFPMCVYTYICVSVYFLLMRKCGGPLEENYLNKEQVPIGGRKRRVGSAGVGRLPHILHPKLN